MICKTRKLLTTCCLLLTFLLLYSGCAGTRLKLHEWTKLPKEHYTIPPYARYLAPYKIALDPGHGGMAHLPDYKRGPTGKREAIMNLNVARFLKEFLEKAGATVFLTREDDSFVSLEDRADRAAAAGCDFMISLHHNFSSNPATNYTAVFYHLYPDYSPINIDLARNIYFGLVEALHLPQVAEDGLLPDKLIYPAGFGLLRRSRIPAILLESSFYSNPVEEKRLMNWRYNRREAYGIFLGLARWAAGGVPSTKRIEPSGISRDKQPKIVYELFDGVSERGGRNVGKLLIFSHSVAARIDSQEVPVQLNANKKYVTFQPDSALLNGIHTVQVDLQNMFKNHNFPRLDTLIIASPTDSIGFQVVTRELPADTMALVPITLTSFDIDGQKVWDGTVVTLEASRGTIAPSQPKLKNGDARAYYRADSEVGPVVITAAADARKDTLLLSLVAPGKTWVVSGVVVDDSTEFPLTNAAVMLADSLWTHTDANGYFFILNPPIGFAALTVTANGYTQIVKNIEIDSSKSNLLSLRLKANLGGLLHNEVIILDTPSGGLAARDLFSENMTVAQANLSLIRHLADTLRWAGAKPILVPENETELSIQERIEKTNKITEGWYLKFGYQKWDQDSLLVQTTIYPANQTGERIAKAIIQAFSQLPKAGGVLLQNTDVPEVTYTNKTAIEVILKCQQPMSSERDLPRLFDAIVEFQKKEREEPQAQDQPLD